MISVLLLALGGATSTSQDKPVATGLTERLIARVPENLKLEGKPMRSPDGQTVVPAIERVTWSADGAQVGYVGLEGEGEVPHPVLGDHVFKAYDYASGPVFGRDGARGFSRRQARGQGSRALVGVARRQGGRRRGLDRRHRSRARR